MLHLKARASQRRYSLIAFVLSIVLVVCGCGSSNNDWTGDGGGGGGAAPSTGSVTVTTADNVTIPTDATETVFFYYTNVDGTGQDIGSSRQPAGSTFSLTQVPSATRSIRAVFVNRFGLAVDCYHTPVEVATGGSTTTEIEDGDQEPVPDFTVTVLPDPVRVGINQSTELQVVLDYGGFRLPLTTANLNALAGAGRFSLTSNSPTILGVTPPATLRGIRTGTATATLTLDDQVLTFTVSVVQGGVPGGATAGGATAGGVTAGGVDAGGVDAGGVDAGGVDAGGVDAGGVDAGGVDAGGVDAGGVDGGNTGDIVTSLTITPASVSMNAGETSAPIAVVGQTENGTVTIPLSSVNFSSSDEDVATVNTEGRVVIDANANDGDTATITVSYAQPGRQPVTALIPVVVDDPALIQLNVASIVDALPVGGSTTRLIVEGLFSDGTVRILDADLLEFLGQNGSLLAVNDLGIVTSNSNGQTGLADIVVALTEQGRIELGLDASVNILGAIRLDVTDQTPSGEASPILTVGPDPLVLYLLGGPGQSGALTGSVTLPNGRTVDVTPTITIDGPSGGLLTVVGNVVSGVLGTLVGGEQLLTVRYNGDPDGGGPLGTVNLVDQVLVQVRLFP